MGLNKTSTGKNIIKNNAKPNQEDYVIALVGNPNVGKSTIFNALTGLNQHTGNWTGKTVESAFGTYTYNEKKYMVVDLPGTYSLFPSSKEEEVTRDFICFEKHDLTVIVVDATMIERNLNLVDQIIETEDNVIVCVNLMDEAKKRNIKINIKELENILQDKEYALKVFGIERGNAKPRKDIAKFRDVKENIIYLYDDKYFAQTHTYEYDKIQDKEEIKKILQMYLEKYFHETDDKQTWFENIKNLAEELGYAKDVKAYKQEPEKWPGHVGDISTVLRVALTARRNTPDMYEIMQIFGKERIEKRFQKAIEVLEK